MCLESSHVSRYVALSLFVLVIIMYVVLCYGIENLFRPDPSAGQQGRRHSIIVLFANEHAEIDGWSLKLKCMQLIISYYASCPDWNEWWAMRSEERLFLPVYHSNFNYFHGLCPLRWHVFHLFFLLCYKKIYIFVTTSYWQLLLRFNFLNISTRLWLFLFICYLLLLLLWLNKLLACPLLLPQSRAMCYYVHVGVFLLFVTASIIYIYGHYHYYVTAYV